MSRFWILLGAFTVTASTFGLALLAGTWAFDFRRYAQHEGRLERALRQAPTIDQLTEGLAAEGAIILAAPETSEARQRAIATHGGHRAGALREKAGRWARLQVFQAADMLYFVFFDDEGVMRDFVCVGD